MKAQAGRLRLKEGLPQINYRQMTEIIKEAKKGKSENIIFIVIAILVILVWFFLPVYMNYLFKFDNSFDIKGKFGDMYNVATSLFGALTIILILYNTHLTRIELS